MHDQPRNCAELREYRKAPVGTVSRTRQNSFRDFALET